MIEVLLKVNDKDFTAMILRPFKIGRHKLWGDDTGRLMNGKWGGTLVGIFPKLTVIFSPRTQAELTSLTTELDKASQTLGYYSPKVNKLVPLGTYTGDYELSLLDLDSDYEPITVSFISLEKEK